MLYQQYYVGDIVAVLKKGIVTWKLKNGSPQKIWERCTQL